MSTEEKKSEEPKGVQVTPEAPAADFQAAGAQVGEKQKKSCGEKCSDCKKSCAYSCHHKKKLDDETMVDIYLNNTCKNWGKICIAQWLLWGFIGVFFWAMMELVMAYEEKALYGFLIAWAAFMLVVIAGIVNGHKYHVAEMRRVQALDATK